MVSMVLFKINYENIKNGAFIFQGIIVFEIKSGTE